MLASRERPYEMKQVAACLQVPTHHLNRNCESPSDDETTCGELRTVDQERQAMLHDSYCTKSSVQLMAQTNTARFQPCQIAVHIWNLSCYSTQML
jgi:hypothetical protein